MSVQKKLLLLRRQFHAESQGNASAVAGQSFVIFHMTGEQGIGEGPGQAEVRRCSALYVLPAQGGKSERWKLVQPQVQVHRLSAVASTETEGQLVEYKEFHLVGSNF